MAKVRLIRGDATETWPIDDNSLDSIVTDPPYGIAFMGKRWDDKGGPASYQAWTTEWASEAYRTLKPGGFLLAFGATRMSHRMAVGIEDAGFKIVDTIEWLYLTGFPKAQDIGKMFDKREGAKREVVGPDRGRLIGGRDGTSTNHGRGGVEYGIDAVTAPATDLAQRWDGWKTPALKPAHEPIIVAQKPFGGTYIDNIEEWGVGAINVDGCRVPTDDKLGGGAWSTGRPKTGGTGWDRPWMHDDDHVERRKVEMAKRSEEANDLGRYPANIVTLDVDEWYSPYFNITPRELSKKASPSEKKGDGWKNTHPTVKPVELIRWLQRLVTPPGGTTMSPFIGSGTDAVAAILEGFDFIGMDKSNEYWPIVDGRLGELAKTTEFDLTEEVR